jgi:hypothetical protein
VEKNARARNDGEEETRARKKDEEEETRAKEKEEGDAENTNKRGRLCIPKTMQR